VIGDMSKEQELHHQQMLEPLRVAIYPTNIAGRIAFSSQAGTVLVGVRPDLRSDECWSVGRCSARTGQCCRTLIVRWQIPWGRSGQ
jgi:hypothetical protein